MPDFLIIGVQKGGTTSLYEYLIQHPLVTSARIKEVHFFDLQFDRGVDWYLEQFPPRTAISHPEKARSLLDRLKTALFPIYPITGEASPYYLFHPLVAQRVAQLFPKIKIIVLLRNPVDRAISQYFHEVRLQFESLSLEEAIEQEPERLKGEVERIMADPNYHSYNHRHYSYLARGQYADQLEQWFQYFPRQQFLILKSEAFYEKPNQVFDRTCTFLNLPVHTLEKYEKFNSGQYHTVNPDVYRSLVNYFLPHNQKLVQLLGQDFDWSEESRRQKP